MFGDIRSRPNLATVFQSSRPRRDLAMYFIALATDYDGTLAEDGLVSRSTLDAWRDLKQSGRKLILVTGRELPDLQRVFPDLDIFDVAVVENGAVLFEPADRQEIPLGDEPPPLFIDELRRRNV